MQMTKKHWMIVAIIIALILVWYFFLRKKPAPAPTVPAPKKTADESGYIIHSFGDGDCCFGNWNVNENMCEGYISKCPTIVKVSRSGKTATA